MKIFRSTLIALLFAAAHGGSTCKVEKEKYRQTVEVTGLSPGDTVDVDWYTFWKDGRMGYQNTGIWCKDTPGDYGQGDKLWYTRGNTGGVSKTLTVGSGGNGVYCYIYPYGPDDQPDIYGGTYGGTWSIDMCNHSGAGPLTPSSSGDPHFVSWTGEKFDFHGECDLVLLQSHDFNEGEGLYVHIRTKIEQWWSHIASAAVKLGDHTLEIDAGDQKIRYWLDGLEVEDLQTGEAALGSHAIKFKRHSDIQSQTRIDLGHGNALSIETYKKFVRVNVKAADAEKFNGIAGMLGAYPSGKKLARDMVTEITDSNEFGFEWQVLAHEHMLFHTLGSVQHPKKCIMPQESKKTQKRRLGEVSLTEEDAKVACARVAEKDRDACIFDVIATQDKDMAGSY